MTHRRFAGVLALACAFFAVVLVARPARAWQESHEAFVEVRATVDQAGVAHFEQAISYRVVRGPLRSFDIEGVEKGAVPEADATITAPDGRDLTAHVEAKDGRILRVSVDDPHALTRGTFVFHVKYTVDLVAAEELVKDGAMWRLTWTAPIATEGFDGGKVVFALPPAPTEPRAVNAETGNADESVLSSLKRTPEADELELVRPHVARGEAATWSIRMDPRAFPLIRAPQLRPPPAPPPAPPDRIRDVALVVGLAALATLFALLVRHKERAFAAACARRETPSVAPLGLVRVGATTRAVLAGCALAVAIALQIAAHPTLGALFLAAAMLLAAVRAPDLRVPARGPGKWLALMPEEAFAPKAKSAAHWLDLGGRAGKLAALGAVVVVAALAVLARAIDAETPFLVVLDAAVLLPLFVTGRAAQLPPDLARAPASRLRALHLRLRGPGERRAKKKKGAAAEGALRVVPWARVPAGQTEPDELRLLALPRVPMPGLLGIEVGVAWARTPSGYDGDLEVLVRVQEATFAAARVASLAPKARVVPGRREGERVVSLSPRTGTRAGTAALVMRLARELTDRRRRIPEAKPAGTAWTGPERRVPPKERASGGVRVAA